jgi:hypothetical protein
LLGEEAKKLVPLAPEVAQAILKLSSLASALLALFLQLTLQSLKLRNGTSNAGRITWVQRFATTF